MTMVFGAGPDGNQALGSEPSQPVPVMAPSIRAGAETVISELDHWAMREHGVLASQLDQDGLQDLAAYVVKQAEEQEMYWQARNERMKEDQQSFALRLPETRGKRILGKEQKTDEELAAENAQTLVLPDPYLYAMKVINTLAGAGFTVRVPSSSLADIAGSQHVESFLYWWWREWERQMMFTRVGAPDRTILRHSVLRGWLCVLTMPDSDNPRFPWRFLPVDPLQVYPQWDERGLVRVLRKYELTAMQARRENFLAAAADMLEGYGDDDTVSIIAYYDAVYHFVLMEGRPGAVSSGQDRRVVKRPLPHGLRDSFDRPTVPWVIVLPVGDFSGGMEDDEQATAMVGLGILFGVHDVYAETCRLVSLLLTNVALSTEPPVIHYIRPGGVHMERLVWQPSAVNFAVYQQEQVQVLNPAPNPINLQPLMAVLSDRSNKATLPSLAFGETLSGISGYAVNLLTTAARDILFPYIRGYEQAMQLILQRALEIYRSVTVNTMEPLVFAAPQEGRERRVLGQKLPLEVLEKVGTEVDVTFGRVTPADEAAMAGYLVGLVQTGILSRYSARDRFGIKDPMVEEQRIYRESILQNPMIAALVGPAALQLSDDDFLKAVVAAATQAGQAQEAQRQREETLRQQGQPGSLPTSSLPLELQSAAAGGRAGMPPPGQAPGESETAQARDEMLAFLLGGSPPAGA